MGINLKPAVAGLIYRLKEKGATQGRGELYPNRTTIDLGVELPAFNHNTNLRSVSGRCAELSEVGVICFLEGVDPVCLPVSDCEAARIQSELASLKQRDPLEAYVFCCEWILAEGSFRYYSQRGRSCHDYGDEGGQYAS